MRISSTTKRGIHKKVKFAQLRAFYLVESPAFFKLKLVFFLGFGPPKSPKNV